MPTHDARSLHRILLIEDTRDDETLALRALRGCGRALATRVARDGFAAWRELASGGEGGSAECGAFDLVISDLKLPGFDGRELLCRVRGDARLAGVPFVVFSSSNEARDVQECLRCGADAFAQKPVDYTDYLDCLGGVARWALDGFPAGGSPPCVVVARGCGGEGRGEVSA